MASVLAVSAPATADDAVPRSFTLAASGDITIQQSIWEVADAHAPGYRVYDFAPLFAPIAPWIASADLAICHLEASLSPDNSHIATQPRFSAPHELADGIASAGYDACSTASNHALDHGLAGLSATLDVLDATGVDHFGTARSEEDDHPLLLDVNGVTVGLASYTIGTNGRFVPQKYAVNYMRVDEMLEDAAWARSHGAEFVVLSIHWGNEYKVLPAWHQITAATELMASPDVDLIVGHHTHVIQPIEVINGKYVIYGMSNHLSNIRGELANRKQGAEDGIIVHFEVTEQPDGSFAVTDLAITPTWAHPTTKEILPVDHTLAYGPPGNEAYLQQSLALTLERIGYRGIHPRRTATPWPPLTCRGEIGTIVGTDGDDLLTGTDGDDVIVAGEGDDAVWAGDGDDLICLGDGDDFANGGDGDDHIRAGEGDDLVLGHDGADTVWGGSGHDVLSGLGGADLIIGESGDDALLGGDGDDILWGGSGEDRTTGGDGTDACRGAARMVSCEA